MSFLNFIDFHPMLDVLSYIWREIRGYEIHRLRRIYFDKLEDLTELYVIPYFKKTLSVGDLKSVTKGNGGLRAFIQNTPDSLRDNFFIHIRPRVIP